jgi:hypothetical protein
MAFVIEKCLIFNFYFYGFNNRFYVFCKFYLSIDESDKQLKYFNKTSFQNYYL